ncbi:hypothetical protein [Sphingomonas citri]|uniref:hypothetical protein n=1 Tax=Sphingomonas citri TaxID=2862499 RepID=UPI0027E45E54|nr:hypothetical protein [Sphingomonas citri]
MTPIRLAAARVSIDSEAPVSNSARSDVPSIVTRATVCGLNGPTSGRSSVSVVTGLSPAQ